MKVEEEKTKFGPSKNMLLQQPQPANLLQRHREREREREKVEMSRLDGGFLLLLGRYKTGTFS